MSMNTKFLRFKQFFKKRWYGPDIPNSEPTFQTNIFLKDIVIFGCVPTSAFLIGMFIYKLDFTSLKKSPQQNNFATRTNELRSQVLNFGGSGNSARSGNVVSIKKAPGSLVKVRLLNRVETFGSVPVHAQIIDGGLGKEFLGGLVIGDAQSDPNNNKIKIEFRLARYPNRSDVAYQLHGHAMSLDGTLGVDAIKKEGFFARSALRAGVSVPTPQNGNQDLRSALIQILLGGATQEINSSSQVEINRSQVLTLGPSIEFYIELTDYFPGRS